MLHLLIWGRKEVFMIKGLQVTRKHQNTSTGLSFLLLLHRKLQSYSVKIISMCYLKVLEVRKLLWASGGNTKMLAGLDSFLNIAQNAQFSSSRDTIAHCCIEDSSIPRPENLIVFPSHSFSLLNICEF